MPEAFKLTADISARLTNLNSISKQIKGLAKTSVIPIGITVKNIPQTQAKLLKQIGNTKLKIDFDPKITNNVSRLKSQFRELNKELRDIIRNASTANSVLDGMAKSFSRFGTATNKIVQQKQATKELTKSTREATSAVGEFARVSGLSLRRNSAFLLATTAVFGLVVALKDATTEAIEFDKQLVKVAQVSDRSVKSLSLLTDEITKLSTGLGVSSKDLITAAQILQQAGLSVNDTKTALDSLAKTTLSATFGDIASTTEGVIALMSQFKLESEDLGISLGAINKVAADFAVESEDIISAIKRTGGVFAQTSEGIDTSTESLNKFIALFTTVRATTRESADSIATGLRTIFIRLERPETIEFFKNLGVQLTDLNGKFVGPFEAISRLQNAFKGLNTRDFLFARIVEQLGGIRQASKVIPLLTETETTFKALQSARQGQNSLNENAQQAQQALATQIQKTREEFVALIRAISQDTVFRSLVTDILDVTRGLISLANALRPVLPLLGILAGVKAFKFGREFFAPGSFFAGLKGHVRSGFAVGGQVTGGRGGIDDIVTRLTAGEFVLRKEAVKAIGLPILYKLNALSGSGARAGQTTGGGGFGGGVGGIPGFDDGGLLQRQLSNRQARLNVLNVDPTANAAEIKKLQVEIQQIQFKLNHLAKNPEPTKTQTTRRERQRQAAIRAQKPSAVTPVVTGIDEGRTAVGLTQARRVSQTVVNRIGNSTNNLPNESKVIINNSSGLPKVVKTYSKSLSDGAKLQNKVNDNVRQDITYKALSARPSSVTYGQVGNTATVRGGVRDNAAIIAARQGRLPDGRPSAAELAVQAQRQRQANVTNFLSKNNIDFSNAGVGLPATYGPFLQDGSLGTNRAKLGLRERLISKVPTFSAGFNYLQQSNARSQSYLASTRAGKFFGSLGGATGIGLSVGGSIVGNQLSQAGYKKTGAGITGATSGAFLGAQLGSIIPGVGTALGALGGAIVGFVSSIRGAKGEEELEKFSKAFNRVSQDINRSAKEFSETGKISKIEGLSANISSFASQTSVFGQRTDAGFIRNKSGLLEHYLSSEEIQQRNAALLQSGKDTRSQFAESGALAENVVRSLAGRGKSAQSIVGALGPDLITALQLQKADQGQLTRLAEAGNASVGGDADELNRVARQQLLSGGFIEGLVRSQKALSDFNRTVVDSAQEMNFFAARMDIFSAAIDRISTFGDKQKRQNDALLSRRSGGAGIRSQVIDNVFENTRAYTSDELKDSSALKLVASAGGNGAGLAKIAVANKNLQDNLPKVLNDLLKTSRDYETQGKSGAALTEQVINSNFGDLPDSIRKGLITQIQKQFKTPGELQAGIADNSIAGIAEKPIEVSNQVLKKIVDVTNKSITEYEQVLNQFVSLNKEAAESFDKFIRIESDTANTLKEINGGFLSVADRSRGENLQITALGKRAGIGGNFNVSDIVNKEQGLTNRLQQPFSGSPDTVARVMTNFSNQQQYAVAALEAIVNNTSKQVALQSDLNSIVDSRGAAQKILEDVQFGSASDKRDFQRSIELAQRVREGGEVYTERDRTLARQGLQTLNTFAGAQGPEAAFGFNQQLLGVLGNNASAQKAFGLTQEAGFNKNTNLNDFLSRKDANFQGRVGQLRSAEEERALAQKGLANINQRDANQFLTNGTEAFNRVQNSLLNPDGILDRLTKTLGTLPEEIKIGGNVSVNLTLNGAEVLANIQPEIHKLIKFELEKQISKVVNPLTGETNRK